MLKRVLSAVLVVPDAKNWGSQLLGAGSILDVAIDATPGPLGCDEIAVQWVDVAGRTCTGWIAQTAMVGPVQARTAQLVNIRDDLHISPVDYLRDQVHSAIMRDPRGGWTLRKWLRIFGDAHRDALVAATRELGGIVRGRETTDELTRRVLRLAVNQEPDMSTETETTEAAATKPAKKSAPKKAPAPAKAEKKSSKADAAPKAAAPVKTEKAAKASKSDARPATASVTLGTLLVKLLKKAKADEGAQTLAAKMAEGKTPTAKQMVSMRDAINIVAGAAREKENTELATELSNANRLVRRLARSLAAE